MDNIVPVWRMKGDERGLWKYKEITLKSYEEVAIGIMDKTLRERIVHELFEKQQL